MNIQAPVHFSSLKAMSRSPAHYLAAVSGEYEDTRAMRIGTAVHHLVLGPHTRRPLHVYPGEARRGKDWERFAADVEAMAQVVTQPEWDEARVIADAVVANPVAAGLLMGARREVSLEWEDSGILCATDGIDFVSPDGFIGDLKTTTCTEPEAFARHAVKLLYHAQGAWLDKGARENQIDTSKGFYLIGVEVTPPFAVTCGLMTPPMIEHGRKLVGKWLEQLRVCRENDHWPPYTQTIVDLELPPWMGEGDGDEDP